MGTGCSSSLRIIGDSSAIDGSGRTGGVPDRSAGVELRDVPEVPPDSCHGRVSGINKICFLYSSYCRSQATAA